MHVIAAKAVAFGEALQPEFKLYAHAVVENAKALADTIASAGYAIVTGGTDNHLMLVDLRPKGLTGKAAEAALGRAHITCNKNGVPFDPEKPMVTSGIRLGTPACTTRGFGVAEFRRVGELIVEVLDGLGEATARPATPRLEAAVQGARARTDAPLPDLRLEPRREDGDALSLLRQPRHAGEGLAPDGRCIRHPPPARLPRLRRPLHHLRARATARADRREAVGPARAVRPRQAAALGRGGAAQAPGRARSGSSA